MKTCTRCKVSKDESEFYKVRYKGIKVPKSMCKPCQIIRSKELYHSTPIEVHRKRGSKWRHTSAGLYFTYNKNAQISKTPFSLTKEIFQHCLEQPCYYCGSIPTIEKPHGLDKIEPKKGYILGNIVVCCWKCNSMKGKLNINDFLSQCRIIDNFRGKREEIND